MKVHVSWILPVALACNACASMLHGLEPDQARLDRACPSDRVTGVTATLCKATRIDWRYANPAEHALYDVELSPMVERAVGLVVEPRDRRALAVAADHASLVDVDALRGELAAVPVDRFLAERFVAKVVAARAQVMHDVAAQPARWRTAYVSTAASTRAAWEADATRRAPWRAKLRALTEASDRRAVEGGDAATALAQLLQLHRGYVAACVGDRGRALEDCLGDEVARPLTRAITDAARRAGQPALATAESTFFAAPDHSTPDRAVRIAVAAEVATAQAEYDAWARATGEHRDPAAIEARWPEPPFDPSQYDLPGEPSSDRAADPSLVAQVASVQRRGTVATLRFRRNVLTGQSKTGCHDSAKIDRIVDGTVYYREVCTGPVRAFAEDRTPPPVTVPWVDARGVRPLDVVAVAFEPDRHGFVMRVRPGDASLPLVLPDEGTAPPRQLREFAVEAP